MNEIVKVIIAGTSRLVKGMNIPARGYRESGEKGTAIPAKMVPLFR